jgi:hypothetical protein
MTQYVRNILKVYRRSTIDDIADGVEWYARAQRMAQSISAATGLHINTVIGVMAALSPNNRWEYNVRNAYDMCTNYIDGGDIDDFKVSTYGNNKRKAWSMLEDNLVDDDDILTRLNGQKTRSFYSNIRGLDEVTIDGHALNIARGVRINLTDDQTNIGKRLYRELQAAYVRAAKRVGIQPHELQAITWTTWRREHGIS